MIFYTFDFLSAGSDDDDDEVVSDPISFLNQLKNQVASALVISNQFFRLKAPPGGLGGAEPPQRVDPLSSWLRRRRRRRRRAEQKSCFDLADTFKTSSLWVGDHRYTSISCTSKLLWVQSHLKSDFFLLKKLLNAIQHFTNSMKITKKWFQD